SPGSVVRRSPPPFRGGRLDVGPAGQELKVGMSGPTPGWATVSQVDGFPRVADFGLQGTASSPILSPPPILDFSNSKYKLRDLLEKP
ncbi:MAG: hypothetical protein ACP5QI_04715, partial [Candidatus Bathyarchaeia archaeon]